VSPAGCPGSCRSRCRTRARTGRRSCGSCARSACSGRGRSSSAGASTPRIVERPVDPLLLVALQLRGAVVLAVVHVDPPRHAAVRLHGDRNASQDLCRRWGRGRRPSSQHLAAAHVLPGRHGRADVARRLPLVRVEDHDVEVVVVAAPDVVAAERRVVPADRPARAGPRTPFPPRGSARSPRGAGPRPPAGTPCSERTGQPSSMRLLLRGDVAALQRPLARVQVQPLDEVDERVALRPLRPGPRPARGGASACRPGRPRPGGGSRRASCRGWRARACGSRRSAGGPGSWRSPSPR
jgi:hypothetical protein